MRRLAIVSVLAAACGGDDVHHLGDAPNALHRRIDAPLPGAPGRIAYQHLYDVKLPAPPTLRPSATFTRATR